MYTADVLVHKAYILYYYLFIIIYLANETTSTMTVVNKKNNINVDYWIGEDLEAGEKKGRLGGGGKGVG